MPPLNASCSAVVPPGQVAAVPVIADAVFTDTVVFAVHPAVPPTK